MLTMSLLMVSVSSLSCDFFYFETNIAANRVESIVQQNISEGIPEGFDPKSLKPYKAPWLRQLKVLLWRSWQAMIKNSIIIWIKIFQNVVRKCCIT